MFRRVTSSLIVALGVTVVGALVAVPMSSAQNSPAIPTVRFVYLVPSDKNVRPEYTVAIEKAARHFQAWMALQLGGPTYRLHANPVEVYRTLNPESYYVGDGAAGYGFWTRGVEDGFFLTGGRYRDPNNIWVFYIDAQTTCVQNGGAGGNGVALVSKDDLDGLLTAKPYDRCGVYLNYPRERWIGGLGHEVGHALGLPHPAECDRGLPTCDWGALMFAGYANYPRTYLRDDERLYLSGSPFISATWESRDSDGDGLSDGWESSLGLNPLLATGVDGAAGDPDGDGIDNRGEMAAGTHPRGALTRSLAEGASSTFLNTSIALLNPGPEPASVLLRFLKADGTTARVTLAVPPASRRTVETDTVGELASSAFSTVIESDRLVVADRTMSWGAGLYGAHAETSSSATATTWFLAEGSTVGRFNLFYLIQNPGLTDAVVTVTYLRPAPQPPLTKHYNVAAQSRFTVWVNQEGGEFRSTDVSGIVSSDQPVIVERAMYMDSPGFPFMAGHASAGVTSAAQRWFFAEGATGPFFDLFLLVANPTSTPANITATYLLPDGTQIEKRHIVEAHSRFNIWVDLEDPKLADTAVSTIITSADAPVIAERSMWWPGSADGWTEAHNSAGATGTGTYWAIAAGEQGGAQSRETYILIANTSSVATPVRVTLYLDTGEVIERTFVVAAHSRFNVSAGVEFPAAANRRFGATVQSTGPSPGQLVVEQAMYWDSVGVRWAAGTNMLATRLVAGEAGETAQLARSLQLPTLEVRTNIPITWREQQPQRPDQALISNVDTLSEQSTESSLLREARLTIHRHRSANQTQLPISTWFDEKRAEGQVEPFENRAAVTIDGKPAVQIDTIELVPTRRVFIAADGDVIEIGYPFNNSSHVPSYERIVDSLRASLSGALVLEATAGWRSPAASPLRTGPPSQAGATSPTDPVARVRAEKGKHYQYGAQSGAAGSDAWDCSELVKWVYPELGDVAKNQESRSIGTRLAGPLPEIIGDGLEAGDVLFFDANGDGTVDHTGIYVGDGRMVHASPSAQKVVEVDLGIYWVDRFYSATRPRESADGAHWLTIVVSGPGGVRVEPGGFECKGSCTLKFTTPGSIRLIALPDVEAEFTEWGGSCASGAECVLTMNANHAVSAIFTPGCVTCMLSSRFSAESRSGFGWTYHHDFEATAYLSGYRRLVLAGTFVGVADNPSNPNSPTARLTIRCVIPLTVSGPSMSGTAFSCRSANMEGVFGGSLSVDGQGKKTLTGQLRLHNLFVAPWTAPGYAEDTGQVPVALRP